tara:strand:- start:312 stop:584 length:273 start_codon:yes stop_codon:yes gene_type:complete
LDKYSLEKISKNIKTKDPKKINNLFLKFENKLENKDKNKIIAINDAIEVLSPDMIIVKKTRNVNNKINNVLLLSKINKLNVKIIGYSLNR